MNVSCVCGTGAGRGGRRGVRDEHELIPSLLLGPRLTRSGHRADMTEVLWSPNGAICIITFCTHRNNPDTADTQTHQQPLTKPQLSVSHNKAFYFHAFLCTVESLSVGREREREVTRDYSLTAAARAQRII